VQSSPKLENLKALTSLRFIAAMMVVAHHALNVQHWPWPKLLPGTMFHGVSFFFVLSGFILTHVYSSKPLSYPSFLRSRFARLWPVHVAAICLLAAIVPKDSVTFDGPGMFDKWVVLGFNLTLLHSLFPFVAYTFSWNSVSWSISTEMFFYLAFPLLLLNIDRTWHWKLIASALVAAALVTFWWALGVPQESPNIDAVSASFGSYPNPLMRGLEFCTGMATWVLWNRYLRHRSLPTWAWTLLEIALLALCVYWLKVAFWWPIPAMNSWVLIWYGPAGSFWMFAILIAVFASSRGILAKVLSIRPFVFLGEISFSIYMLHLILMKVYSATFQSTDFSEASYFSVLFLVATASYLLVEKPGQRLVLRKWRSARSSASAQTSPAATP